MYKYWKVLTAFAESSFKGIVLVLEWEATKMSILPQFASYSMFDKFASYYSVCLINLHYIIACLIDLYYIMACLINLHYIMACLMATSA